MKYLILVLALITAPAYGEYCYGRAGLALNFDFADQHDSNNSFGGSAGIGCRHHLGGNWYGDANFTYYTKSTVTRADGYAPGNQHGVAGYYFEYRF